MQPTYRMPPRIIADLVDAPPTPAASLGPDRATLVLMEQPSYPPIAELAEPELRLAGLRLNPRTNGPSRRGYLSRLLLMDLAGRKPRPITGLPRGARIGEVAWSPDGARLSMTITEATGVSLWVAEIDRARATRLTEPRLNATYGPPCEWLPDSRSLLCKMVPLQRGPAPTAPAVPSGPVVQENLGRKAPARTYQDLLKNPHDEALLDHYLLTQLVRVTLDGRQRRIGRPDRILSISASPDGRFLLVLTLHPPYSYRVPIGRFPHRAEVWDRNGKRVRVIADLPLAEEVPVDFAAVVTGPRAFEWRADAPATLCWTEARDGGDPKVPAEVRDELLCLAAPFRGRPRRLAALGLRYGGVLWGDGELALVDEWWWETRRTRTWIIKPDDPVAPPRALFDRSYEDRYGDPGRPVMRPTARGPYVLATPPEGGALYLVGAGASPAGNLPFLDRLDLATFGSERLWRARAPHYEYPVDLIGASADELLTRRESVAEPPQFFLRHLPGERSEKLTDFPHPAPGLTQVDKQLIRYRRADGVELTAMLYLPPGYQPNVNGRLPVLIWAYPHEFKSAAAAGQVTDSPHRFVRADWSSPVFALTQGFAVVDDPAIPIVGEGEVQPNDTYVAQLVAGAEAVVRELVERGVADPDRIAVGGHSYGAFMTANLLAHTDLFCAGIARSGAYNRTLTPFSFQSEERTFWQAPQVYIEMSPFTHADKIRAPLLLIHGEADANPGTFPMQSERLFEALKGLGGTVRYVSLPHESHGYRARESIMHALWEMTTWLDTYSRKRS